MAFVPDEDYQAYLDRKRREAAAATAPAAPAMPNTAWAQPAPSLPDMNMEPTFQAPPQPMAPEPTFQAPPPAAPRMVPDPYASNWEKWFGNPQLVPEGSGRPVPPSPAPSPEMMGPFRTPPPPAGLDAFWAGAGRLNEGARQNVPGYAGTADIAGAAQRFADEAWLRTAMRTGDIANPFGPRFRAAWGQPAQYEAAAAEAAKEGWTGLAPEGPIRGAMGALGEGLRRAAIITPADIDRRAAFQSGTPEQKAAIEAENLANWQRWQTEKTNPLMETAGVFSNPAYMVGPGEAAQAVKGVAGLAARRARAAAPVVGRAAEAAAPVGRNLLAEETGALQLGRQATEEQVPQARRFYHGTGARFGVPDAAMFDPNGLKGPAYYLSDNAEVAGGIVDESGIVRQEGYAQKGQTVAAQQALQAKADAIRARGGPNAEYLARSIESQIRPSAPNVRAVDIPQNLNLFNTELPDVPAATIDQIAGVLPQGQQESFRIQANNARWQGPRPAVSGETLYNLLADVTNSKGNANAALEKAGFDGLEYAGGRHMPLLDDQGRAIEHTALAIFRKGLPKIRNAISGTAMGSAPEAGGAVVGAMAYQDDPNLTPAENLARRAAFMAGGAGLGNLGRRLGSKSRLGGTIEDASKYLDDTAARYAEIQARLEKIEPEIMDGYLRREAAGQASTIIRPRNAGSLTNAQIEQVARDHGLNPFMPGWDDALDPAALKESGPPQRSGKLKPPPQGYLGELEKEHQTLTAELERLQADAEAGYQAALEKPLVAARGPGEAGPALPETPGPTARAGGVAPETVLRPSGAPPVGESIIAPKGTQGAMFGATEPGMRPEFARGAKPAGIASEADLLGAPQFESEAARAQWEREQAVARGQGELFGGPTAQVPTAPAAETAKMPWEQTKAEYIDGHTRSPAMHRYGVELALKEGRLVPPEVLAEYPDLAAKYGKAAEAAPATPAHPPAAAAGQGVETIRDRLAGRTSARIGTLVQGDERLYLALRPDTSVTGTYSVVVQSAKGSQSYRMQFKAGESLDDAARSFEEYLNTDNKGAPFKVELSAVPAQAVAPTKAVASPRQAQMQQWKAELNGLEAIRFKTATEERQIDRLKRKMAADPSKWQQGQGVAWKVTGNQTNRGFRIVEVRPDTGEAVIRQVADTGLTSTGGNYDRVQDQLVDIVDLMRDRKYDTVAPTPAPPPQNVAEVAALTLPVEPPKAPIAEAAAPSPPPTGRVPAPSTNLYDALAAVTPDEVQAGRITGVRFDSQARYAARANTDGTISLGQTFWNLEPEARMGIVNHELGHYVAAEALKETEWQRVLEPFRLDREQSISVRSLYDNFAGLSQRPEEMLADVYAGLLEGANRGLEPGGKYAAVYDFVASLAQRRGMPTNAAEVGQLHLPLTNRATGRVAETPPAASAPPPPPTGRIPAPSPNATAFIDEITAAPDEATLKALARQAQHEATVTHTLTQVDSIAIDRAMTERRDTLIAEAQARTAAARTVTEPVRPSVRPSVNPPEAPARPAEPVPAEVASPTERPQVPRTEVAIPPPAGPGTTLEPPSPQRPSSLPTVKPTKDIIAAAYEPDWIRRVVDKIGGTPLGRIVPHAGISDITQAAGRTLADVAQILGVPKGDIFTQGLILRESIMADWKSALVGAMSKLRMQGDSAKLFGVDKNGMATIGGNRIPLGDVLQYPDRHALTAEQRRYAQTIHQLYDDQLASLAAEGIEVKELAFEPGGHYVGRRVMGKVDANGEIELAQVRPAGPTRVGGKAAFEKHRTFTTEAEGVQQGFVYLTPEEVLQANLQAAGKKIADKRLADFILKQIPYRTGSAPEALRVARDYAKDQLATVGKLKAVIMRGYRGERVPPATVASIGKFFPNAAKGLLDAAITKLETPSLNPISRPLLQKVEAMVPGLKTQAQADYHKAVSTLATASERARTPRYGESTVMTPAFQGKFFSEADALKLRQILDLERPSALRGAAEAVSWVNALPRLILTTVDVGWGLAQGTVSLFSHPIIWSKAMGRGFHAMASPKGVETFLNTHADTIRNWSQYGLTTLPSEFSQAIAKGGIVTKVPGAEAVVKPFSRGYETFLNGLRIYGIEATEHLARTEADRYGLAKFWNEMSGVVDTARMGIGPTQRAIETAAFFAPRYRRALLALMTDITKGGLRGSEARKALEIATAAGLAGYIGVAKMLNQPINLDPTDKHFLTVNIAGQNIGIRGSFISTGKAMLEMTLHPDDAAGIAGRYISNSLAPVTGTFADLALPRITKDKEGKTVWKPPYVYAPGGDIPMKLTKTVFGSNLTPIWAQVVLLNQINEGSAGATAAEFAGAYTFPEGKSDSTLTPFQKRLQGGTTGLTPFQKRLQSTGGGLTPFQKRLQSAGAK